MGNQHKFSIEIYKYQNIGHSQFGKVILHCHILNCYYFMLDWESLSSTKVLGALFGLSPPQGLILAPHTCKSWTLRLGLTPYKG